VLPEFTHARSWPRTGPRGSIAKVSMAVKVPVWTKALLHWAHVHTGLPAIVVAGVAVVVGYKILKRSARFALEVAVITAVLAAASELGWLRW
jgi:hypothetical protein